MCNREELTDATMKALQGQIGKGIDTRENSAYYKHKLKENAQSCLLKVLEKQIKKIYVYDDKLTITFNVGENPLTVTKSLLRDINSNLKNDVCSYIEQCSPPK